jgi:hypothetical protein
MSVNAVSQVLPSSIPDTLFALTSQMAADAGADTANIAARHAIPIILVIAYPFR